MRSTPIVPLPQQRTPETVRLADVLGRVLGYLVALLEIPLVGLEAGLSVTGSVGGVGVLGSSHVIDWNDTGVDEVRLVGYARDAASSSASLEYRVNGEALAAVEVPQGSAAMFAGLWTPLTVAQRQIIANDQTGRLFVVGDGVNAALLYRVALQARTSRRVI